MSRAPAVAAVAAVASVFAVLVGLAAIGGVGPANAASTGNSVCATSGPIDGLSDAAAANARVVVAAAEQQAGRTGAVIAIMVGLTESDLLMLGNTDGQQGSTPVQGLGSDHDSIGIFQQRPSWGTVAQRLDPATSTGLFMTRLLNDPGWADKPPARAAQDVQGSAYDGHPRAANHNSSVYGGNYARQLDTARTIVTTVDKDAAGLTCGALTGALPANTDPDSRGLPSNYTIPAAASPGAATAIAYALAQLDKPYVFGAVGPESFDCSGLMLAAWAKAGVTLPHYTGSQAAAGRAATAASIQPGDLILVPGSDGTIADPGHVGMFLGDGLVVDAADEQIGIIVQTYPDFIKAGGGLSTIRHVG